MTKSLSISGIFLVAILGVTPSLSQETMPQTQPAPIETQPLAPAPAPETSPAPVAEAPPPPAVEMPDFQGIAQWLNSEPLTKASLKGKVVLVDFWTYSCINCLRTLPYLKEWYKKYKAKGLVIVGVHSPEFEFERDPANVKAAIAKLQITYPVALDNQMATWTAFKNSAWPAHYFVDAEGHIRHIHLGEGDYEKSEAMIQRLLTERASKMAKAAPAAAPRAAKGRRGEKGRTASTPGTLTLPGLTFLPPNVDFSQVKSPETYLGFLRRQHLVTSGRPIETNEWTYEGAWRTEGERIFLVEGTGKITFRFFATKVNIVLAPGASPVSAVVRLDNQPVPKEKGGKDVQGSGLLINEPRMYELINLGPKGEEHTVEIEFLNPGVGAYAFTFG